MTPECGHSWRNGWGPHTCEQDPGHVGEHRCECDATTAGLPDPDAQARAQARFEAERDAYRQAMA